MSNIITISGELSNFGQFSTMVSEIEENEDIEEIEVHICSEGGDVPLGLAMVGRIEYSEKQIITVAWGEVCSMASWVYLAGDIRRFSKYGFMMIHNINLTLTDENTPGVRSYTKQLEGLNTMYLNYLVAHSNKPLKYWKEVLDSNVDTYFTAKECLKLGLAHEII